jgi:hypothetical protein
MLTTIVPPSPRAALGFGRTVQHLFGPLLLTGSHLLG